MASAGADGLELTSMSARTFLDTNVLVYLFDANEPVKRRRARDLFSTGRARDFVVSTQVLGEFYVCVTRKLANPVSAYDAAQAVASLCELAVVATDTALVLSAIRTCQAHQLSYWDALIVDAAASAGCSRLLTEDLHDGAQLRGVTVENPFVDQS